jgi:hypothetical protein
MLKRCWNHLIGIGIDSQTPASETRQIVFLNAVVLLVLILVGQNIVLGLIYNVPPALLLLFMAHGLCIGIVLLWNKLRFYLFGRLWFAVAATIFLSTYQVLMGTESRWDVFLVVCVFLQVPDVSSNATALDGCGDDLHRDLFLCCRFRLECAAKGPHAEPFSQLLVYGKGWQPGRFPLLRYRHG